MIENYEILKNLRRLNLITGVNGIGKTELLGGIYSYLLRNNSDVNYVDADKNEHQLIEKLYPKNIGSEMYIMLDKYDKKDIIYYLDRLSEFLRTINPNIMEIAISESCELVINDWGNRRMNIISLGTACIRWFYIFCSLMNLESQGYLLIDGIENYLHYTTHYPLLKGLFEIITERNIQVFATTQSLEFIRAAYNADLLKYQESTELSVYRLSRKDGLIGAVGSSREILKMDLEGKGELR